MRCLIVMMVAVAMTGSAAAQSNKNVCRDFLEPVAQMAEAYRALADQTNSFPVGTAVNGLSGDQKEAAEAMAASHAALRPILNEYTERLEDLAYSLRVCLR